jgi:heme exporter protein D
MDALAEFLHMGGYAFFVWTSYAIVALLLAVNLWLPLRRDREVRRRLRRMLDATNPHAHAQPDQDRGTRR